MPEQSASRGTDAAEGTEQTPQQEREELELQELEEPKALHSSMIAEVQWSSNEELSVDFQSGSSEVYPRVSKEAYEELLRSSSPGGWMWANVLRGRPHY